MKGSCCECNLELPAESAAVDTALICSDCLAEKNEAALGWSIVIGLSVLEEDQLAHVSRLIDHLRGANRDQAFESIGIKAK